jgi:hypothetical protein
MSSRSIKVRVKSRFLKSTRIDTPVDPSQLVDGFVLHETGEKILTRVISEIVSGSQRAFTWTGAYGSGKSTLALYLTLLLSAASTERKPLKPKGSAYAFNRVNAIIPNSHQPWKVLTIVGQNDDLEDTLRGQLTSLLDLSSQQETLSFPDIVRLAVARCAKTSSGLLVVIDEMGRHLEHAADGSRSLHCLQELAEIFAEEEFPCGVIGLLHQSFHEYLPRSERQQRQEWEKIQGRFTDILFGLSVEESVSLISSAIEGRTATDRDLFLIKRCCDTLTAGRLSLSPKLNQLLAHALPLHPYAVIVLCLIARQRFGQNERSLFSFLASNEPCGLQDYSRQNIEDTPPYYTLDRLYDYLQVNLARGIAAVEGIGQRWSDAEECVIRAEQIGETSVHVAKVIALTEVFGRASNLVATKDFIYRALPQFEEPDLQQSLDDLQSSSVIEFRNFKGGYALSLGSDIDLDAELAKLRSNMSLDDIDPDFAKIADLAPIVAKRHYHNTGTQRYFDTRITSLSRIKGEKLSPLVDVYDGAFILFLNDTGQSVQEIHSDTDLKTLIGWEEEHRPALHALYDEPQKLFDQALEVAALKRLGRELVELQSDRVARRRLSALEEEAQFELISRIHEALRSADWQFGAATPEGSSLSGIASFSCEHTYSAAPSIFNELVNRHKPSAAAAKARRILMNLMIDKPDSPRLGIEKSPPELGMYLSILDRNGLYPASLYNDDIFQNTSRTAEFEALWSDFETTLKRQDGGERLVASEILDSWCLPPFGIRKGVAPILFLSFLLQYRNKIATYVDGRFTVELDDLFIERLIRVPKTVELRWAELKGESADLIEALARFVHEELHFELKSSPLDIARQLVHFAFKLPIFTKSYRGDGLIPMSRHTRAFRAELLLANDPLNLIYEKLPQIFDIDNLNDKDAIPSLIVQMSKAVRELNAIYPALIQELKVHIASQFPSSKNGNVCGSIRDVARDLQGKSSDPTFDRFVDAMSKDVEDDVWVQNLAGMAAEKRVDRWLDTDVVDAKIQIINLADRFRSLLQLSGNRTGHAAEGNVVSLGVKTEKGIKSQQTIYLANQGDPDVDRTIDAIKMILEKGHLNKDSKIAALTHVLGNIISSSANDETISESLKRRLRNNR